MSEFVDYLNEVFAQFGIIRARKMFGGYGIYYNDVMFGLVADDSLYLKAEKTTTQDFESKGLTPFEYEKNGKKIKMSYYLAPAEIFEDPAEAAIWAERAYQVAFRNKYSTGRSK